MNKKEEPFIEEDIYDWYCPNNVNKGTEAEEK